MLHVLVHVPPSNTVDSRYPTVHLGEITKTVCICDILQYLAFGGMWDVTSNFYAFYFILYKDSSKCPVRFNHLFGKWLHNFLQTTKTIFIIYSTKYLVSDWSMTNA